LIAVDTNILIYSVNPLDSRHEVASGILSELVDSPFWGIPSGVAFEFFAAGTDPRFTQRQDTLDATLAAVDGWLASPGCRLLAEPRDIWPRTRALIRASAIRGQAVHDARIAATCLAHGVTEFWTADGDFIAFPQLRVRNPLVAT
jgi:uncharacterized protein